MITLNIQPTEHQQLREDGALDIVGIWKTIQGEGPFAGTPAVFVRTAGCSLDCPQCDTNYTTGRKLLSVTDLVGEIIEISGGPSLVVLTGGEPLRQNLQLLLWRLLNLNYRVQIETNGTFGPENTIRCLDKYYYTLGEHICSESEFLTLVCSPKTGSINEKLKPYIKHLKYIISHGKVDPEDGLPTDSLGAGVRVARPWPGFKGTVWVQPLDEQDEEKNKLHMREAVNTCLKFGTRLTLQLHKLCGLD